jgi:protein-S-isoprenylcysteine O-methyltransferase Ste14
MAEPQAAANVRIIPPLVPVGAMLLGGVLDHVWPLGAMFELPAPSRLWVGGGIVAVALVVLGAWPVAMFLRSGQNPEPWKPTPSLHFAGPYRLTRNPMYLMMVLVCLGMAIAVANLWLLALTPFVGWILQRFAILPEEAYLEDKFGEDYLAYKRRVRRWL